MEKMQNLINELINDGYYITNDFNKLTSLYMLDNGQYINAESDGVQRCEDHRFIFAYTQLSDNNYWTCENTFKLWQELHDVYNLVRIVPEEKTALYKQDQLNEAQLKALKKLNFEIAKY